MAIRSLTYLDIPAAKRQETASRALSRLRERLADPTLGPDQVRQLSEQASHLEGWASGKLSVVADEGQ